MSTGRTVPLKINGIGVGSAVVYPEGRIEVIMSTPNFHGQYVYEAIAEGEVAGLDITTLDPVPETCVTLEGNRYVQIGHGFRQVNTFSGNSVDRY